MNKPLELNTLTNQEIEIVKGAITSRKSTRAFLKKTVDPEIINQILLVARTAPSGSNIQPWSLHVVAGAARDRLSTDLLAAYNQKEPESREYQYYPVNWRSPYIDRRRETGWGLYGTLNIVKGDRVAASRQLARNFAFFDAPVVLIFTIDKDMELGSWLDYGMFMQNIMIAARGFSLHTCPQAALANYPQIVKRHLAIGDEKSVVCGMSIGYEDPSDPVNGFQPARMELEEFVTYHTE